MNVSILGIPMDLGAGRRGVDMGPSALRNAHLSRALRDLGHSVTDLGDVRVALPESIDKHEEGGLVFLDPILEACRAAAGPCAVAVSETLSMPPCRFDAGIVDRIEHHARALGLPVRRMPSGAFHDAGYMAGFCPTAMIFIPCERGISHNEAENATPDDLAAGARVLADVLVDLAG